ncbi:MAG: hypothetical protein U0Y68_25900 [Blastocatellia bacterium]
MCSRFAPHLEVAAVAVVATVGAEVPAAAIQKRKFPTISGSARSVPVRPVIRHWSSRNFSGQLSSTTQNILKRSGVSIKADLRNLNAKVIQLPASYVGDLAAQSEVTFISPDSAHTLLWPSFSYDWSRHRAQPRRHGHKQSDGTGIGIAILDSHVAYVVSGTARENGASCSARISRTMVAACVMATVMAHTSQRLPLGADALRMAVMSASRERKLLNLRVYSNSEGQGTAASVLSALDWVLNNVPAITMRRQHQPGNACCRFVHQRSDLPRRTQARGRGLVVVAAAGNNGKDTAGNKAMA